MTVNEGRLHPNAGEWCERCSERVRVGEKSERVMAGGLIIIRHVDCPPRSTNHPMVDDMAELLDEINAVAARRAERYWHGWSMNALAIRGPAQQADLDADYSTTWRQARMEAAGPGSNVIPCRCGCGAEVFRDGSMLLPDGGMMWPQ
jgi:hypothetical protein